MKKLVSFLLLLSLTFFWSTGAYAASPQDDLDVLHDVLALIEERFVSDVNQDQLIAGALAGMLQALGDPYSEYFTPEEYADFLSEVTAKLAGVGIVVEPDSAGRWMIYALVPDGPAEAAGLLPGDVLLQADDRAVSGLSLDELEQTLGGAVDSLLTLVVERDEQALVFAVKRALVNQPTVSAVMLPGGVGYVYLESFGENTANELSAALQELRGKGLRALLLDLRDNPGGLMQSVVDVGAELLPAGAVMRLINRAGETETVTVEGPGLELPLAVLVNQWTASAAEILAGAIHDRTGGLLVGERTYGKGVMQDVYELGDNAQYGAVKITSAEFLTPDGTPIQGVGLEPDLAVEPNLHSLPLLPAEETLYPGLHSDAVKLLQQALGQLSLYQGAVNGRYDQVTQNAVSAAQASQGDMVADGVCDAWTQILINDLLVAEAVQEANLQMADTARSWLMSRIMLQQLDVDRWMAQQAYH